MCIITKALLAAMIIVTNNAFQLHGPTDPLAIQSGGALLLPCSVDSVIRPEELKVEWRRKESGTLLFVFKDGIGRTEYQNDDYRDRVLAFEAEFPKGNFSLLISNITKDDAGQYVCSVSRNLESYQVTAEIIVEYLLVTGGNAVSGYVGKEVVLNCYVDSHVPPEKMEQVTWKRTDQDILVLLFQEGEIQSESSDERYLGRAEFFTTEIPKGDFSLRLKDVRTEDKGEYICEVYQDHLAANSTMVLQQLGFSMMHKVVFCLCICAFILALVFGVLAIRLPPKEGTCQNISLTMYKLLHYALVLSPNVIMGIAFILWGEIEGSFSESASCSVVNFIRFLLLFETAPHVPKFLRTLILKRNFEVEYIIVTTTVYLVYFRNVWSIYQHDTTAMVLMGIMFGMSVHMGINTIFDAAFALLGFTEMFFMFLITFGSRTFNETGVIVMVGLMIGIPAFIAILSFLDDLCSISDWLRCILFGLWILTRIAASIATLYFAAQTDAQFDDYAGLVTSIVLVQILLLCLLISRIFYEDESLQEERKKVLYIVGAVGLTVVNSVTLATELMIKTQNGERSVTDLRVIIFSCEGIYVAARLCAWFTC